MVGGNLIFDKRGTFLFLFPGFSTGVSNRGFQLRFPPSGSNHGSQHGSGQQAPAYTQVINRISTSYPQNQNLKLGADFRILEKTPQYIPPLKNLWGIRGYTPLGFKCAYMLGTKKFFGGWGWFILKRKPYRIRHGYNVYLN